MPINLWDCQFLDPYLWKTTDLISTKDSQTCRGSSKRKHFRIYFRCRILIVRKSQKGATSNHLSLHSRPYFFLNANYISPMRISLDNFWVVEEVWIVQDIDFPRCDGSLTARKS